MDAVIYGLIFCSAMGASTATLVWLLGPERAR